ILTLNAPSGIAAERVILLVLGAQDRLLAATVARAHGALAAYCMHAGLNHAVSTLCAQRTPDADHADCARTAAPLASATTYRHDATLSKPTTATKLRTFVLHLGRSHAARARTGLDQGAAIGAGMNLARLLGDLPPNVCTPTYLGNTARGLAKQFKTLKAEVLAPESSEGPSRGA